MDNLYITNSMLNAPQQKLQPIKEPEVKQYKEVMDHYSLHFFMVRKGKTIRESPEFQSYQRAYIKDWP